jgi:hypothetical protein
MDDMVQAERKLLVCYIPGLDKRRISDAVTPTILNLISEYSPVEIRTIPDTELVPTLLSGVYPHQNKIWQVSVDARRDPTVTQRMIDMLPNLITTTAQCIRQKFDPDFDLAAIPPRRRREFTQHCFKYTRRVATPEIMREFNGHKTLFGVLDEDARYRFTHRFDKLDSLARDILASSTRFEFLEMYALDLFQHWHLDNDLGMRDALRKTDSFVAKLRDGCARNGHTLVLLSDHGQELVTGTIPLVRMLRKSGVPQADYNYFCELACARLWFNSDQARAAIIPKLQRLRNCRLLHFSEMHQYDVCFDDARFGEYYLMADAGSVFFPHDFYQPLANIYLGLFGHSQRSRTLNPVHRGNHGYLPHYPSEKGFLVLADDGIKPNREHMSLIDFAPTMLTCLRAEIPAHMTGQSAV